VFDLADRIRGEIAATGPMSIADYMRRCLSDPKAGYYTTRDPFGTRGDFVTAPEVSQMFGELIGLWCVSVWTALGEPERFDLVELGPGRGTLMADLLRAARIRPCFTEAAAIHMVETSPTLREKQQQALAEHAGRVTWHDRIEGLGDGPLLLVANEFFDALPIRQFVLGPDAWRERMVGLDGDGALAFALGPPVSDPSSAENLPLGTEPGAVLETSPEGERIMAEICRRLGAAGGTALIVDYGKDRAAYGDTFQAVARHGYADPLADPGAADLTAHVDFLRLSQIAEAAGLAVSGPVGQGDFLLEMGLLERAGSLGAGKGQAVQEEIRAAVERLAGDDQMGRLFKVMAVSHGKIAFPGFDRSRATTHRPVEQEHKG